MPSIENNGEKQDKNSVTTYFPCLYLLRVLQKILQYNPCYIAIFVHMLLESMQTV